MLEEPQHSNELLERLDRIEAELAEIRKALNIPIDEEAPALYSASPVKPISPFKRTSHPKETSSSADMESVIGTKLLGRVGMLAVVFGAAFFLKYSFDNNLIGETGRVLLGVFAGIGFMAVGEYIERKGNLGLYGQIFTGGGISLLYLSSFAAYSFYHLIPLVPAYSSFIAITFAGIALSARYSSPFIALMGMTGGFLTPILLATGQNRPYALFAYIMILNIGIMAVSLIKHWRLNPVIALFGTVFIYSGWHNKFYTEDQFLTAFPIATAFFVLYNVYAFISKASEERAEAVMIVCASAFYFALFSVINRFEKDWSMKGFDIGITALYFAMAFLAHRLSKERAGRIFAGLSALFGVISVYTIFDGRLLAVFASSIVPLYLFIGIMSERKPLRYAGYLLGLPALSLFSSEIFRHINVVGDFQPVLNERFLVCSAMIASYYLTYCLVEMFKDRLNPAEADVGSLYYITVSVFAVSLLTAEIEDYFRYMMKTASVMDARYAKGLLISIVWVLYALGLITAGMILRKKLHRILGISLAGITVSKVFLFDLSNLQTIYRIMSFVILGAALLIASYFYNRNKGRLFGDETDS